MYQSKKIPKLLQFDIQTTLWQRWVDLARLNPEGEIIVHWVAGEEPFRWKWESLLDRAAAYAGILRDSGVRKGDICTLIMRHHREFYPIYMGVEAVGALPSVLAYPNPRLHPLKFRQGLEGMSQHSGLDWLLTEVSLDSLVRPLATGRGSTIKEILFPLEWRVQSQLPRPAEIHSDPDITPDTPCLLQHSSGTTGLQKGVILSHRAVLEHVVRYGSAILVQPDDRIVSWLPVYHDMGLIASFHLPLACGIPFVQIDPFEWVAAPVLLLEAISKEKGTLSWLPNFAYNFMADRIHDEDLTGIRLDSIRMLINCSEPVRAASHDNFARRFCAYGLQRKSFSACYAMAETTFAVTQSPPGCEATVLEASREDLASGKYISATPEGPSVKCVSSGNLISGCEIMIVDDQFNPIPDGNIGEAVIRSVSMFEGYRNNPAKTAEVMKQGWYLSGDYCFSLDGEYYVLGRKKDIIIVAGKNIYPEDVEYAVAAVPGVIAGRVVAFGYEDEEAGTEQVCVIAETEINNPADRKQLRAAIVAAGMEIDVTIARTYLVPPRWLIKSSSGKPGRAANKQRALAEL